MSAGMVVAGIMFVVAVLFFGLAWWIKSSNNRGEETATLLGAFAIIFAVLALVMLVTGQPNLS